MKHLSGTAATFRVACWGWHREQRTEHSPVSLRFLQFHHGRGTKVEEIDIHVLESMLPALKVWLGCCRQGLPQNSGANCGKWDRKTTPSGQPASLGRKRKERVSCLAWRELIFFLASGTVLCFGFSARIMLVIHWCFQLLLSSTCPKIRIFQLLMPRQQEGWRTQDVKRGCSQDSWPKLAKTIFHTVWHCV